MSFMNILNLIFKDNDHKELYVSRSTEVICHPKRICQIILRANFID